jgi:energy-coupling factor transport system permease protein
MTRFDPLTKLAVAIVYVGYATLSQLSLELALLALLVSFLLLAAERMPIRTFALGLAPFLFFAVTSSWIYAVAPANIYGWTGWQVALAVGLRTVAVGLVSMLFAYTTEPADLGRALVHRLGFSRRFVFGALAAIQFLPSLAEEARLARIVARAAMPTGTARLRLWLAGLNPAIGIMLLAGAIRRAGTAALAMELRGLSATSGGSAWRVPRPGRADALFAAVALGLLALLGTAMRL